MHLKVIKHIRPQPRLAKSKRFLRGNIHKFRRSLQCFHGGGDERGTPRQGQKQNTPLISTKPSPIKPLTHLDIFFLSPRGSDGVYGGIHLNSSSLLLYNR